MLVMRPIICALYGLYHDEEKTLTSGAEKMVSYNVESVIKKVTVQSLYCILKNEIS